MSQKKEKLLRKYLKQRNAEDKVYLTKNGSKIIRHSVKEEIKDSYKTANRLDKRVLTVFFKNILYQVGKDKK